VSPFWCNAKSTIVVVPPSAAAAVPLAKSSAVTVPPKGISRCVCGSMKPGKTYAPDASITAAPDVGSEPEIAVIVPFSIRTSATK
jgi:hypothetical protein